MSSCRKVNEIILMLTLMISYKLIRYCQHINEINNNKNPLFENFCMLIRISFAKISYLLSTSHYLLFNYINFFK